MAQIFNVHCMLCGRQSGQLRNSRFQRLEGAPAPKSDGRRTVCGFCGGSLYLEADDSPFARIAARPEEIAAVRRAS